MNNEIPASQPQAVSIGDDGRFPPLPNPVGCYEYADNTIYGKIGNAYSGEQMRTYLLADRASRAAAPSWAAPDLSKLDRYEEYGNESGGGLREAPSGDFVRLSDVESLLSAAFIQAPAVVADPVALIHFLDANSHSEGRHTIAGTLPLKHGVAPPSPPAPMVADPVRVALRHYKDCDGDVEPDALERLRFFCSLAMNGQDWLDSEKFFDDVAATVNTVPSEAREKVCDCIGGPSEHQAGCNERHAPTQ